MTHTEAFDFRELEARGFKPQARGILEKAISRGRIFPQEISMILSGSIASDRQQVSKTVVWLGTELRRLSVTVATGKDVVEFKHEVVPFVNGSGANPKSNGKRLNGKAVEKPPAEEKEGTSGQEILLPSEETPETDALDEGPVGPQELDEAEVARVNAAMLEDQGSRFESDALACYYKELARFKLLTFEEEFQLGWQVKEKQDHAARNKLVEHNLRLVRWVARKYAWSELPFEDLIQEGNIGLMIAADKYDYRVGRFTTYAMWWVRQRITRAIMDYGSLIRVPVHLQENRLKVVKAAGEIAFKTGRQPTLAEVAEATKLPAKMVQAILTRTSIKVISLDQPAFRGDSSDRFSHPMSYAEIMPDHMALDGTHIIEARDELQAAQRRVAGVIKAIESIGSPSRGPSGPTNGHYASIFRTFYGLDGSAERRTLEETGAVYDVTRERIRQVIAKIWANLAEQGFDMDHDAFLQEMSCIEELSKLVHTAS